MTKHENYRELIWILAKTDFKLRYHGSILGYVWAILKPLLIFAILNFVFSSLFRAGGADTRYYSLQLLVSIILYNFFSEGTVAGMSSLLYKSQLVTKIYVPRWTIILASTINAALIFLMNLIIIVFFFALKEFLPSFESILYFFFFSIMMYVLILSFSLIAAPLYVRLRDLSMVWEVLLTLIFYASPIIYPISILPVYVRRIELLSPVAFIINFTKLALINNLYASYWLYILFFFGMAAGFAFSIFMYNKLIPRIAEKI